MDVLPTWAERAGHIVFRWGGVAEAVKATGIPLDRWKEFQAGVEPTFAECRVIVEKSDVNGTWLLTGLGRDQRGPIDAAQLNQVYEVVRARFAREGMSPDRIAGLSATLMVLDRVRELEGDEGRRKAGSKA